MYDFELAKALIANLDLTSLNKNDTETSVAELCHKAVSPCGNVAAVCVYPKFVPLVQKLLEESDIKIATVVNFPLGGADATAVVEEVKKSVAYGADEIDAVFPYHSFLQGNLKVCHDFLKAVTKAAGKKTLKIILESGSFPSIRVLQDACRLCLEYNINFLKTSTGKTEVSATIEAANAILEVIHDAPRNVGFKASGGIKTFEQARKYYILAQEIMGEDWPSAEHFRIGASSLLGDLLRVNQEGY